jgi:hypothetical protein
MDLSRDGVEAVRLNGNDIRATRENQADTMKRIMKSI